MTAPFQVISDLIIGIDHVGLAVENLDQAISYWDENFGTKLHSREINEEQQIEEALVKFPNGSQLQLLASLDPQSAIGKFLAKHGEGVQQVALKVTDLVAATELLAKKEIPMVYPAPKRGSNGSRINFIHPKYAGGVLLELVEFPA